MKELKDLFNKLFVDYEYAPLVTPLIIIGLIILAAFLIANGLAFTGAIPYGLAVGIGVGVMPKDIPPR